MKVVRGDQQSGSHDHDRRHWPEREGETKRKIDDAANSPAHLFCQWIAFQRQCRRGDPSAQKIHPARKNQQRKHREVFAAAKGKRIVDHFLPWISLAVWRRDWRFSGAVTLEILGNTAEKAGAIAFVAGGAGL